MARQQQHLLPRAVALEAGGGVQLQVVDYAYWDAVSDPAVGGVATLISEPVEIGYYWRVERIVVSSDSTTTPQCGVYVASPTPTPSPLALRDFTRYGTTQPAEYPLGLLVVPNTSLIIRWTGLSAGARGTASVQYQLVARTGA